MKFFVVRKRPEEIIKYKKGIFNFFNLNTIWHLRNNNFYRDLILREQNINFPDGKILSLFLGSGQQRGPSFTKRFLMSKEAREKKHFFIGLENKDLREVSKITKISIKNLFCYNPPYIKELEFSEKEREKMISLINKSKVDFVWVCVGSPKQEILANQLFEKTKTNYFFNIGAATDFLLGRKKESPKIFQKLGLEWFYRFITDFKYSKKKVWRSFVGFCYLVSGRVVVGVREI